MTSKIEWTEETWNPVTGCTKISEACQNCYAERMAYRLKGRYGYPEKNPFTVTIHEDKFNQPSKWKNPRMIFVSSMGDLFHDKVPGPVIHHLIKEMISWKQHTFLILTKRPENMRLVWMNIDRVLPISNIWLGVTAENQERADERIPILLQIPAAVRFVSVEPMLEPINLTDHWDNWLKGTYKEWDVGDISKYDGPEINWVIVGGESGANPRYMDPDWARQVRDDCKKAGTAFFMKQMSGRNAKERKAIPEDLMVREYPDDKRLSSL